METNRLKVWIHKNNDNQDLKYIFKLYFCGPVLEFNTLTNELEDECET